MINLSNKILKNDELQLLKKGGSYIPNNLQYHSILPTVLILYKLLVNPSTGKLYSDTNTEITLHEISSNAIKKCKFINKNDKQALSRLINENTPFIANVQYLIHHLIKVCKDNINDNPEKITLKRLLNDNDIIVSKTDKGNCLTILEKTFYEKECMRHLQDEQFYSLIDNIDDDAIARKISNLLRKALNDDTIDKNTYDKLNPKKPYFERNFYILPKCHKNISTWPVPHKQPPGRPIIVNTNSVTQNIGKYIDTELQKIVDKQPFVLKSTNHFISVITHAKCTPNSIFFTMDVTSLYTNIPLKKGLDIIDKYCDMFPTCIQNKQFLLSMLEICIFNNEFKFKNQSFKQKKE